MIGRSRNPSPQLERDWYTASLAFKNKRTFANAMREGVARANYYLDSIGLDVLRPDELTRPDGAPPNMAEPTPEGEDDLRGTLTIQSRIFLDARISYLEKPSARNLDIVRRRAATEVWIRALVLPWLWDGKYPEDHGVWTPAETEP